MKTSVETLQERVPDELHTERLTLRSPDPKYAKQVHQAISDSLAELKPWMVWANPAPSLDSVEANAREARENFRLRRDLQLVIFLKGTDTVVGGSGLHRMDWNVPRFEIGYWVRTPYANKGYITEAVKGITEFALETLEAQRLEILMSPKNERSRLVPERLGYRLEAKLERTRRDPDGSVGDTLVYVKLGGDSA